VPSSLESPPPPILPWLMCYRLVPCIVYADLVAMHLPSRSVPKSVSATTMSAWVIQFPSRPAVNSSYNWSGVNGFSLACEMLRSCS